MAATIRSLRLLLLGRAISVALVLAAVGCGPAGDTTKQADTTTSTIPTTLIELADGEADGSGVIEVVLGETVDLWVVSDIDDELHVHGYDLVFEVAAGVPLNLSFVADIPGVFEVEVHSTHAHVFDIRVVG